MIRIVVLFPYQWGYNTDFYFFCDLLSKKYKVTYIGYDLELPAISSGDVNVIGVPYKGKLSIVSLFRVTLKEVRNGDYSHIFLNYFISSSLLALLLKKKLRKVVDIRTSFIYKNRFKTKVFNSILKLECSFFKNITVVSDGVKRYLNLPERTHPLPLGAPSFPIQKKSFDRLNFLYVGTFYDRNIVQTIRAFAKFVTSHGDKIPLRYTIIGYGTDKEVDNIKSTITSLFMDEFVYFIGTVRYPELTEYLLSHNVGISYIPLTTYYDCQPPTKTFEYLLSGSVVLGTNTTENARVINPDNGVLTSDEADDFYKGMILIYDRRNQYDTAHIQAASHRYSWTSIVDDNLVPFLKHCD